MNDHTRAGQPWSDDEDAKLITWGAAVGYDYAASHDLGREEREGADRIAWLRANDPKFIGYIEAELERRDAETEPPDMRRKENRYLRIPIEVRAREAAAEAISGREELTV
jgi:hypothetical protein